MDKLIHSSHQAGVTLTPQQIDSFSLFLKELLEWNEKFNLTAIRNEDEIILKHFIDSLSVAQAIPTKPCKLIDIGTGAGFPGIPLKIIRPDLNLTLVDASAKKVSFLDHMISTLHFTNAQTIHERVETLGQMPEHREQYDVVTNRAVAELSTLAEYSLPFLKIGGLWIAQKSGDSESPEDAVQAIATLGGELQLTVPVLIDGLSPRQLLIYKKLTPTPQEYPRRIGVPTKKPL